MTISEMEIFSYIDQLSGFEKDELIGDIVDCCIGKGIDVSVLEDSIIEMRKNRFLEDLENRPSREILENYCDKYGFDELIYYLAELSGENDDE